MKFDLWLEFEHVDDVIDDFCNVVVRTEAGEAWALNVWTFAYFEAARQQPDVVQVGGAEYLRPPDLFVSELSRAVIEAVVGDLLDSGQMAGDPITDAD